MKMVPGVRIGRLELLNYSGVKSKKRWQCRCDCGSIANVLESNLRTCTKSCGCLKREPRAVGVGGRLPNGEAAFRSLVNNYKARGIEWRLSLDEARILFTSNCHYCGKPPAQVKRNWKGKNGRRAEATGAFVRNGIDRVNNSSGYIPGNCVACCKQCNTAKNNLTLTEFKEWVARVYHYACQ